MDPHAPHPPTMIEVRLVHQHAEGGWIEFVPIDPFPLEAGGECVFLGRTRLESHPVHGRLVRLSYEAYADMAEKVLRELAQRAAEQFGCVFVRIHHALGEVPVGGASVLVQTACPHRAAAFDACRFLIHHLKSQAPIWKREQWADGCTWSAGVPVRAEEKSMKPRMNTDEHG